MITKRNKQKKQLPKEDIIFQIVFILIIFFMVGALLFSNYKMRKKRSELASKVEALQQEIDSLEGKKIELESGISDTKDPAYWEEKIRNQGYIKEGENQVVVLDESGNQINVALDDNASQEGLFQKFKNFLASLFQR
jgi:cell division protein FtsB